ncbi:MAG: hypothetical protein SAK29_31880 [Scytonema sp. PMC 1069.18]|nr:hypothetical protein [Scytonema sp. PMC 1069.18]MEC4884350.1 hypothetical protein [Scytonema sp. PMC 1070.18]
MGKALYADCPLTKKAIADALQIKSPSVWRYDKTAYYFVRDYQQDYPELPKEQWLIKKSKHDRTIPLTPYQTWVISLIRTAFVILKKEKLVREYIQVNGYVFSKSKYTLLNAELYCKRLIAELFANAISLA